MSGILSLCVCVITVQCDVVTGTDFRGTNDTLLTTLYKENQVYLQQIFQVIVIKLRSITPVLLLTNLDKRTVQFTHILKETHIL